MGDPDQAFEAILRAPLRLYSQEPGGKEPVMILLDALDEAGTGADSQNNLLLKFVCEKLCELPCIRLIITSRWACLLTTCRISNHRHQLFRGDDNIKL